MFSRCPVERIRPLSMEATNMHAHILTPITWPEMGWGWCWCPSHLISNLQRWSCPYLLPQARREPHNSTMATGGENFNPAYEAFRKHSAGLLTVIQDPEVLAWELYAENIITSTVRDAANNMMHERGKRTSDLLAAVDSRIVADPGTFDVFLSVLANCNRPSMSDLCERMKETYCKSPGQAHLDGSGNLDLTSGMLYLRISRFSWLLTVVL